MTTGRINQVTTGQTRRGRWGPHPRAALVGGDVSREIGARRSAPSPSIPQRQAKRGSVDYPYAPTEFLREPSAAGPSSGPRGSRPTPQHGHPERRSPGARHARGRLRAPAFPPRSSVAAAMSHPPTDRSCARQQAAGTSDPPGAAGGRLVTAPGGRVGTPCAWRPTYHLRWAGGASAALKGY